MIIETERLVIQTASEDEMNAYIEKQTDPILITAYKEMLQGCLDHPQDWDWYAIWFISLKDGSHVGDLSFKGLNADGSTVTLYISSPLSRFGLISTV